MDPVESAKQFVQTYQADYSQPRRGFKRRHSHSNQRLRPPDIVAPTQAPIARSVTSAVPEPLGTEASFIAKNPMQSELDQAAPRQKRQRLSVSAPLTGLTLDQIVKDKAARTGVKPGQAGSLSDPKAAARDYFKLQGLDVGSSPPAVTRQSPPSTAPQEIEAPQEAVKKDWREDSAFKNPRWFTSALSTLSRYDHLIPVLATMSLLRHRPITKALKHHFNVIEREVPQQGVDLVLSASIGVLFFKLEEAESKKQEILNALKTAIKYYRRIVLVLHHTRAANDAADTPPAPPQVQAVPALRRAIAMGTAAEGPGGVELVCNLLDLSECALALRGLLEQEFVTIRSSIGDLASEEICERREWLFKDEVSTLSMSRMVSGVPRSRLTLKNPESNTLALGFDLNSYTASYMMHKCGNLDNFAFDWTDQDRHVAFDAVAGAQQIVRLPVNRKGRRLTCRIGSMRSLASASKPSIRLTSAFVHRRPDQERCPRRIQSQRFERYRLCRCKAAT
jgi:hypothetical protein